MADDALFRLSDAAIVLATLIGPVVAVQVQKYVERRSEARSRQMRVFEDLMATRASRLAPKHVDALNAIPITFYGSKPKLVAIRNEWNDLLAHFGDKEKQALNRDAWQGEQIPKLVSLLFSISEYLGFNFSKADIERGIYAPQGHALVEEEQHIIRNGFANIFRGKVPFPVLVFQYPPPPGESWTYPKE
ncbi:DUF6680 family protein [Alsobacter soli]|uniref:DUF6680 family protein n=1 Tax=Alsobacter soli TaxID=2109933 RepID=UPI0011B23D43|nr:DUF6680 family protein [Alsobacter soli]